LTVATCLAHACLPKDEWLARRDLPRVHWPVWGPPAILEYDQGPENEARGIQRGRPSTQGRVRRYGIDAKIRPKGHSEQHGTIERLIGTMMRMVHELRGTTWSGIAERGESEPEARACLALPELERMLALAIDSYNHATHGATGERPIERYLAYYRRPDLPDAQRIPSRLPADRFLLDFLPFERRALRRTGVALFKVDYSSIDLLPLWRRDNQQLVERVVVYDPRSLARVWLLDDATDDYIAVPYRIPI
jgi:putative transposase